mgnify:CR=1 FL=1
MNRKLQRLMQHHGLMPGPEASPGALFAGKEGDDDPGAGGGEDRGDDPPPDDPDDDPEDDASRAAHDDDPGGGDDDEPKIPKSRFDEAVQRERERAARAEEQLQRIQQSDDDDQHRDNVQELERQIDAKEDEYEEAVFNGEKDKAKNIRRELRELRDQDRELRNAASSDEAREQALEQVRYDQALADVEASHPVLNPNSENFNNSTAGEVAEVMQGLQARGYSADQALRRATRYVVGEPSDGGGKEEDPEKQRQTRQERSREGRRRSAEAKNKQPEDQAAAGSPNDRRGQDAKSVQEMSEKEFNELPEEEKARLRGDAVE